MAAGGVAVHVDKTFKHPQRCANVSQFRKLGLLSKQKEEQF